ncbi:conserved hypothetical protein [Magnetospirillum sp. LM-5]|uniref:hypothetical protein n=1 Tax=Magnetospirillum sp. LM-5 TaxID=2681466 RepID=UPI001382C733|nr:hypothetical protein [Magnetospirillum sp. LM-5]CAA7621488.1 conserved hypothetical protein [Magnetospirillum sp. LM-5]
MAEINRVGGSSTGSGLESIRQSLGLGTPVAQAPAASGRNLGVAAIGGRVDPGAIGGPRGNRILPADFPLDQLDRRAARGTYLDILV